MTTKTAVIWSELEGNKFVIVETDWSRFEGVFINSMDNEELQKELSDLVYDAEFAFALLEVDKEEFAQAIRQGAAIVGCGFIA